MGGLKIQEKDTQAGGGIISHYEKLSSVAPPVGCEGIAVPSFGRDTKLLTEIYTNAKAAGLGREATIPYLNKKKKIIIATGIFRRTLRNRNSVS